MPGRPGERGGVTGGQRVSPVALSCSTIRPVVITASHSRTYRSSSEARDAISALVAALVAAGIAAMTSNSPVR